MKPLFHQVVSEKIRATNQKTSLDYTPATTLVKEVYSIVFLNKYFPGSGR